MRPIGLLIACAASVALYCAAAVRVPAIYEAELATPFPVRTSAFVKSGTCQACHADHWDSWARTFHRTMTQDATEATVRGAFDGRERTLWGVVVRPVKRDGRFFIEYLDRVGGKAVRTIPVLRTVGSRRYQQYLTQDPASAGDNWFRIPVLWHLGEERWIHLNGAFLGNDEAGFDEHLTTWNSNCIFCHNTHPQPGALNLDDLQQRKSRGEDVSFEFDPRFKSSVGELGIACESCHGPAAEHEARNRDPFRRQALHSTGHADPTIINPDRLDPLRSAQVCGQCHGNRVPKNSADIMRWLVSGPDYRAGDDLAASTSPIWRDTPVPGRPDDDLFKTRFWDDGTARLTAYEYQGLLQSACHVNGGMTCTSCHSMHEGDVHGQITPKNRTNVACTGCHKEIGRDVPAHTHHGAASAGSSCYECHMPRMVYGVLEIHRSHRIENPDAARDAASRRPNACTSCHVDRTLAWAGAAARAWWGDRVHTVGARADGVPADVADVVGSLWGGDAAQRAVAAKLAGRADSPGSPAARAFLVPNLIGALDDNYPAVRWFARQSLIALDAALAAAGVSTGVGERARAFDYIAPLAERRAAVAALDEVWRTRRPTALPAPPAGTLVDESLLRAPAQVQKLKALQSRNVIRIGE